MWVHPFDILFIVAVALQQPVPLMMIIDFVIIKSFDVTRLDLCPDLRR